MHWYAIYTKSRNEKKLAERLEKKGFEVYAPTQTVIKQWSDRKKKVEEVLFKSYVFARFDLKEKIEILQTPGAVALINWLGKPAVIRDEEMQAIQNFLNEHPESNVATLELKTGEKVRIAYGSLKDQEGVVRRQTKHKVTLEISPLGLALTATVPKSQISKN